jgi:hypothetical protein
MLAPWHEFYAVLGEASVTLVALLFVAVSIGVGLLSSQSSTATRTYMSPIILHYASVLCVSLIALVPTLNDTALAALVAAVGIVGIGYSAVISTRLWRDHRAEVVDRFAYGAWPFVGYAGALVAAWLIFTHAAPGPDVLAASMLLLLLVNIRNAWDLAVTFARRHADNAQKAEASPPIQPPAP